MRVVIKGFAMDNRANTEECFFLIFGCARTKIETEKQGFAPSILNMKSSKGVTWMVAQ